MAGPNPALEEEGWALRQPRSSLGFPAPDPPKHGTKGPDWSPMPPPHGGSSPPRGRGALIPPTLCGGRPTATRPREGGSPAPRSPGSATCHSALPPATTLLVGTERSRLKMAAMSCLLGSHMTAMAIAIAAAVEREEARDSGRRFPLQSSPVSLAMVSFLHHPALGI